MVKIMLLIPNLYQLEPIARNDNNSVLAETKPVSQPQNTLSQTSLENISAEELYNLALPTRIQLGQIYRGSPD